MSVHRLALFCTLSCGCVAVEVTVTPQGGQSFSAEDYVAAVQQAVAGELQALRRLLEVDASFANASLSSTGATALHFAAARGETAMLELLLEHGAAVAARTTGGASPLSMACGAVQLDTAVLLVQHGALGEPSCGAAALHAAVSRDRPDVVLKLLRGGAAPSVAESEDGATPLHLAAIVGSATIASVLLAHGASHTVRYKDSGEQPLHIAALKSHVEVARVLLDSGASLEATNANRQTPLLAAAMHGEPPMVAFLLERGARAGALRRLGSSALHEVAARGDVESVKALLRHGAIAEQGDAFGDTPLSWAAARGHHAVARALVEGGGATLRPNRYGLTPLHAAAFMRRRETMALLCELCAAECAEAEEARDAFGATPADVLDTAVAAAEEGARARVEDGGYDGGGDGGGDGSLRGVQLASLPPEWREAAAALASPTERALLVDDARLSDAAARAAQAGRLVLELALAKQSLTFERRVRTMLGRRQQDALLMARGLLRPAACAALRGAVDAAPSLRNGTTDGLPEHTLHLTRERLEELVGAPTVAELWALPARFVSQAAPGTTTATATDDLAASEIFVRRFSAATRPWVKMHADVAAVTVNVALTSDDDYAGGRLLGAYDHAVQTIGRAEGDTTVHASSLLHGVSRMAEGARYSLIVFFE